MGGNLSVSADGLEKLLQNMDQETAGKIKQMVPTRLTIRKSDGGLYVKTISEPLDGEVELDLMLNTGGITVAEFLKMAVSNPIHRVEFSDEQEKIIRHAQKAVKK